MNAHHIDDPIPEDLHSLSIAAAQVQTQSHCNGRCVICPYRDTRGKLPQGVMTWELFTKVIDELLAIPTLRSISPMLQNEPLLDKRLPEAIRYIKTRKDGIHVGINTNGALLTPVVLAELVEAGLDKLIFSLNAVTRETFEKVQPELSFDTIMINLDNLISNRPAGLDVAIKAMVIRENMVELVAPSKFSDLSRRLEEAGIPFGWSAISNRAGSLDGYDEMLVLEQTQSSKAKLYCHDLFESTNILFNGDVIACCADWSRKSVVGNVKSQSIAEVWQSEKARSMREAIAAGRYEDLDPCGKCSQARNIVKNIS